MIPQLTFQSESIIEAETHLDGLPIRMAAAFKIDSGFSIDRAVQAWRATALRMLIDLAHPPQSDESLYQVERGSVSPLRLEGIQRRILQSTEVGVLFSHFAHLSDGRIAWTVFAHHSVMDGVGLAYFLGVLKASYENPSMDWPYMSQVESQSLAANALQRQLLVNRSIPPPPTRPSGALPFVLGSKRRRPTPPMTATIKELDYSGWRSNSAPEPTAIAFVAMFVAVLLSALSDSDNVQLSIPRAGVRRDNKLPLGTFAYTVPLYLRLSQDDNLSELLKGITRKLENKEWNSGFRDGGLRSSYGPNVNNLPIDLNLGPSTFGESWTQNLVASGPVEDVDFACGLRDGKAILMVQIGMERLSVSSSQEVVSDLRDALDAFSQLSSETTIRAAKRVLRRRLTNICRISWLLDRETAETICPRQSHDVAPIALSALRDLLGLGSFDADADFFDLGGTSMDAVAVCSRIESELDRSISPSQLFYSSSIDEFISTISRESPVRSNGIEFSCWIRMDLLSVGAINLDEARALDVLRRILALVVVHNTQDLSASWLSSDEQWADTPGGWITAFASGHQSSACATVLVSEVDPTKLGIEIRHQNGGVMATEWRSRIGEIVATSGFEISGGVIVANSVVV